ncbi:unnamed protein product [Oikopleura dioica]|uniref:Uncharacterized protein n=1 Tax=Oikopleura dioica TaxID=34765 RepID=E4XQL4_OIKDI|nr:unnamed protein product [Oikopleura dioica]
MYLVVELQYKSSWCKSSGRGQCFRKRESAYQIHSPGARVLNLFCSVIFEKNGHRFPDRSYCCRLCRRSWNLRHGQQGQD